MIVSIILKEQIQLTLDWIDEVVL